MYLTILAHNRLSGSGCLDGVECLEVCVTPIYPLSGSICLDGVECLEVHGKFPITSWSSSVGGGTNCPVALLVGSASVLVGFASSHGDVVFEVCGATPIYPFSGSVCLDGVDCLEVYGKFSITSWSSSVGGGTNCPVALLVGSASVLVGSASSHGDVVPIYRLSGSVCSDAGECLGV